MGMGVKRIGVVVALGVGLADVVLAAGATPAVKPAMAAPASAPADIARGKALFTGTCGAYCHRPSGGSGGGEASDAPNLFDCDWKHGGTDADVFRTITKGVEGTRMVAFGGAIPDADIWRIIGYLRSASQCPAAPKN